RTLYSLRHTYATLALVSGDVDIHTLSRQMGTSVAMLERHYSKLTATMAAARLG
ncbi:MAG: integrase, partial [Betaproteobacteria bacterium]